MKIKILRFDSLGDYVDMTASEIDDALYDGTFVFLYNGTMLYPNGMSDDGYKFVDVTDNDEYYVTRDGEVSDGDGGGGGDSPK